MLGPDAQAPGVAARGHQEVTYLEKGTVWSHRLLWKGGRYRNTALIHVLWLLEERPPPPAPKVPAEHIFSFSSQSSEVQVSVDS